MDYLHLIVIHHVENGVFENAGDIFIRDSEYK